MHLDHLFNDTKNCDKYMNDLRKTVEEIEARTQFLGEQGVKTLEIMRKFINHPSFDDITYSLQNSWPLRQMKTQKLIAFARVWLFEANETDRRTEMSNDSVSETKAKERTEKPAEQDVPCPAGFLLHERSAEFFDRRVDMGELSEVGAEFLR